MTVGSKAPALSAVAWQQVRELRAAFRATSANKTARVCVRLTAVVSEGEVGALAGEAEAVRGRLLVFIRRSHDSDHLREEKNPKVYVYET